MFDLGDGLTHVGHRSGTAGRGLLGFGGEQGGLANGFGIFTGHGGHLFEGGGCFFEGGGLFAGALGDGLAGGGDLSGGGGDLRGAFIESAGHAGEGLGDAAGDEEGGEDADGDGGADADEDALDRGGDTGGDGFAGAFAIFPVNLDEFFNSVEIGLACRDQLGDGEFSGFLFLSSGTEGEDFLADVGIDLSWFFDGVESFAVFGIEDSGFILFHGLRLLLGAGSHVLFDLSEFGGIGGEDVLPGATVVGGGKHFDIKRQPCAGDAVVGGAMRPCADRIDARIGEYSEPRGDEHQEEETDDDSFSDSELHSLILLKKSLVKDVIHERGELRRGIQRLPDGLDLRDFGTIENAVDVEEDFDGGADLAHAEDKVARNAEAGRFLDVFVGDVEDFGDAIDDDAGGTLALFVLDLDDDDACLLGACGGFHSELPA